MVQEYELDVKTVNSKVRIYEAGSRSRSYNRKKLTVYTLRVADEPHSEESFIYYGTLVIIKETSPADKLRRTTDVETILRFLYDWSVRIYARNDPAREVRLFRMHMIISASAPTEIHLPKTSKYLYG